MERGVFHASAHCRWVNSKKKSASRLSERERELFAITIHYYSIRIHRGTLLSIKKGEASGSWRPTPAAKLRNVVHHSVWKTPSSQSNALILLFKRG